MLEFRTSMIGCDNPCPLEVSGHQTYCTPGVGDHEWVCRTVRPQDYNAKGVLKSSFVHMRELKAGQLSSFRLGDISKLTELADRLPAKMNGIVPDNVIAVRASRLREIKVDDLRAVCVINDTRANLDGSHDEEHITLSPCGRFHDLNDEAKDEIVAEIRNKIVLAYWEDGTPLRKAA